MTKIGLPKTRGKRCETDGEREPWPKKRSKHEEGYLKHGIQYQKKTDSAHKQALAQGQENGEGKTLHETSGNGLMEQITTVSFSGVHLAHGIEKLKRFRS